MMHDTNGAARSIAGVVRGAVVRPHLDFGKGGVLARFFFLLCALALVLPQAAQAASTKAAKSGLVAAGAAFEVCFTYAEPPDALYLFQLLNQRAQPLAAAWGQQAKVELKAQVPLDYSAVTPQIFIQHWPVLVGPANVIGTATRFGYVPVAAQRGDAGVVFAVPVDSKAQKLADLRGQVIALPAQESLVAYLARGLLTQAGFNAQQLSQLHFYKEGGAALLALTFGNAAGAALSPAQWESLKKQYPGRYRLLLESTLQVPGMGVALSNKLPEDVRTKLAQALLSPDADLAQALGQAGLQGLQPIAAQNYAAVAELGYFTPRHLDGAKTVDFAQVRQLMAQGVTLIDDRASTEYAEGHIAGAVSVPYIEHSDKNIGFDASKDQFDLLSRFPDKSRPLIIACNGPECWKSYKGVVFALRHGYKTIYWYREGFPDWVKHGGPVSR
jgi:ABC-type phosphate/phosphonate transport system substrate-binding protein/rhodanese-related sulfurtransferase